MSDLKTPALRQPERVEAALGLTVEGLVAIVAAMRASVIQLEVELGREFETHPLAPVLRSAPGLGAILAARVLAEVGDDPDRFTTANGLRAFAGTAPVTRASGRSGPVCQGPEGPQQATRRRMPLGAFAALTWSPGARSHYDQRRTAGEHHNAALRNVANKLIARMWWCIANNQPWDEHAAWPAFNSNEKSAAA